MGLFNQEMTSNICEEQFVAISKETLTKTEKLFKQKTQSYLSIKLWINIQDKYFPTWLQFKLNQIF